MQNLFESEVPPAGAVPKAQRHWSYSVPGVVFDHAVSRGDTSAAGYMAFGHSAGSQFLHRQMCLAPDPRLLLGIAANAGWYTLPSLDIPWPYGLKRTGVTEDNFKPFLGANMIVLLGIYSCIKCIMY
jgi:hypothetical protein